MSSSGDRPQAQTLEEPSGEPDPPAAAGSGGGEEPRVFGVGLSPGGLPEGALGVSPGEDSRVVDVKRAVVFESRSYTSMEVVEEVEMGSRQNGSEAVEVEGSQGKEKIEDGGASGVADVPVVVEGGDGGGGGEPPVACFVENPYSVGDFVWGKIKSHPWWPGQVYDSSDASEYAKKVRRRDEQCVLVAYFGDGTFAWCDPSQLRPFTEGFEQMVRLSTTKNFVTALKEALDEIQRCLESEMACACVQGLSDRRVLNAGIREGATVPRGSAKELSIGVPAESLERLHEVACDVSVSGLLEIVVIKSWLSAFNRWMGWRVGFPAEHPEGEVEGPVEVSAGALVEGFVKEEGLSTLAVRAGDAKRWATSGDKSSSHRKKVRSMAELIAETYMDMDMPEDSIEREKELKPTSPTPGQRKKGVAKSSDAENVDAGQEEGAGSGRRERKRSKYLSPPYTTLSGHGHLPISPRGGDAVLPKKDVEASQVAAFPTIMTCNTEAMQDKTAPLFEGADTSADEMLSEFLSAALDPMYLKGNRSSSRVRVFFSRFRNYSYANVSDYGKNQGPQSDSRVEELRNGMDGKKSKRLVHGPEGFMEGKPETHVGSKTPEASFSACGQKSGANRKKKSLGPYANDTKLVIKSRGKRKSVGPEVSGPEQVKPEMMGNKEVCMSGPDMESNTTDHFSSVSGDKSSAARKKKSPGGDAAVPNATKSRGKRKSVGQEAGGPKQVKPEMKRKNQGEANGNAGAALLLTFAPGNPMPSKEDIISAFSKFGALCESQTELLKDSGCARVVFAKSSDAERVFRSPDQDGVSRHGIASYGLQYLHDKLSPPPLPPTGQKPPLQFLKKSLEGMICALKGSSPPGEVAGSSDQLKPEARENLVDEMDGLLKKVNKMLAGPAAGAT